VAFGLNSQDVARMLREAALLLKANRDLLSQLDSAIGDGDHGATMCRVADAILSAAEPGPVDSVGTLLDAVGWSVLSVDGGSASPLVGSLLLGMAEGCRPDTAEVNGDQLAGAFEAGLARFRAQTPAQVGDKTMLDALAPAVEALRAAAGEQLDAEETMARAAAAARNGAESTKALQAKFGRARNLGPRSVGFADPGATSISLLFAGFHAALIATH
jgi:phosphoenolpyruvate---glycerone phosphotransferase subunit DhaL